MGLNLKELKQITSFCKKNGVFKLKTADFELELSKDSFSIQRESVVQDNPITQGWDTLTPEQQILWSSTPTPIGE